MNSLRSFGNFEKPGLESFGFLIFATNKRMILVVISMELFRRLRNLF